MKLISVVEILLKVAQADPSQGEGNSSDVIVNVSAGVLIRCTLRYNKALVESTNVLRRTILLVLVSRWALVLVSRCFLQKDNDARKGFQMSS